VDILRSILKHIVQRRSFVSDEIRELHKKHTTRETLLTLKDVGIALESESSHFTKIFLVVDALDECPTSEHTVEILLQQLENLQHKVQLMITGRPFADGYLTRFASLAIREIGARHNDLELFVRGQLNLDQGLRKLTSAGESTLGELIVQKVVDKAKGM